MASNSTNINIPIPQVEIKLFGDWARASQLPEEVRRAIKLGYDRAIRKCANSIVSVVKKAMKTGIPPQGVYWAPLAPSTLSAHGKHRIYNLSGFYANSINIYEYKGKTVIGVPSNIKHPGGLTVNQLAIILEFGSSNTSNSGIPKRPLWKPAFEAYGGREKLKKEIIKSIIKSLPTGITPTNTMISW